MIYPAIWWAWSPPMELVPLAQDPLGNLGMFLIPSLILGTYLAASTMRMTRTVTLVGMQLPILVGGAMIIENIFNLAKGLLGRSVMLRHALNERDSSRWCRLVNLQLRRSWWVARSTC